MPWITWGGLSGGESRQREGGGTGGGEGSRGAGGGMRGSRGAGGDGGSNTRARTRTHARACARAHTLTPSSGVSRMKLRRPVMLCFSRYARRAATISAACTSGFVSAEDPVALSYR